MFKLRQNVMEMAQLIPPPHLSGAEAAFSGVDLGLRQRVLPQLGLSAAGLGSTCSWLFGMNFCAIGSGTCGSPRLHSMWCWECGNEGFKSAVLLQDSCGVRIQGAEELCSLLKNSQGWVSLYQLGISPSLHGHLHVQIGFVCRDARKFGNYPHFSVISYKGFSMPFYSHIRYSGKRLLSLCSSAILTTVQWLNRRMRKNKVNNEHLERFQSFKMIS